MARYHLFSVLSEPNISIIEHSGHWTLQYMERIWFYKHMLESFCFGWLDIRLVERSIRAATVPAVSFQLPVRVSCKQVRHCQSITIANTRGRWMPFSWRGILQSRALAVFNSWHFMSHFMPLQFWKSSSQIWSIQWWFLGTVSYFSSREVTRLNIVFTIFLSW